MTKRAKIRAAGAVVLRGDSVENAEVLVVHRPAYDDWSLPKGKGKVDELPPQTAVREVLEETGVRIRLGVRLPTIRYTISKGDKAVEYWRAEVISEDAREADDEVDTVRWLPIDEALKQLTYDDEKDLLKKAVKLPRTTPLLLVRHGKAMLRKHWTGPDQARRLASRGRRQAKELVQLLGAYDVQSLVSSSSARCVETLKPYSKEIGAPIVTEDVLTEEEGTLKPRHVRKYVAHLLASIEVPTAICGHRPVLPSMFEGLGLKPKSMVVAEVVVVHRDDEGNQVAVEVHKPTA